MCTRNCVPSELEITPEVFCGITTGPHLTFEDLIRDLHFSSDVNYKMVSDVQSSQMQGFEAIAEELEKDYALYNYIVQHLRNARSDYQRYARIITEDTRSSALSIIRSPENATVLTCQALGRFSTVTKEYMNSAEHRLLQTSFSELGGALQFRSVSIGHHFGKAASYYKKSSVIDMSRLKNLSRGQGVQIKCAADWQLVFSRYLEALSKAYKDIDKLHGRWCAIPPTNSGDRVVVSSLLDGSGPEFVFRSHGLCQAYAASLRPASRPAYIGLGKVNYGS